MATSSDRSPHLDATVPAGDAPLPTPAASVWVSPGVRTASEWTWRLGVIALALYGLSKVFREFSNIIVPLVIALLLAALLYPLVDRLARAIPRGLSALAVLLGTLAVVIGLFALVGQQAASGFPELRDQAAAGLEDVRTWLRTGPLNINADALAGYVSKAEKAAKDNQSTLVSGALGLATTATHLAEGFFIALFAAFFFLSSGHRIWAWLLRIGPERAQRPIDDAARSGWVTLSHYVRATLLVALIDGIGIGVGAALLGVPLALPLGVLVFLGAFIPIVGALVTGALAVLVALVANGPVIALAVAGVVLLVQQIESHVLQPFLLGRAVDVHPLAVILAIATGATVAGIVGALFAVPAAAVGNTMITSLAGRHGGGSGEPREPEPEPLGADPPPPTDVDKTPGSEPSPLTDGGNGDKRH
ncbi:MAG: AI-2E family transporter [Nocardioidaceae bacterium]|nr:AI-2E family transporter [Nocardioidaceae bacterium]